MQGSLLLRKPAQVDDTKEKKKMEEKIQPTIDIKCETSARCSKTCCSST